MKRRRRWGMLLRLRQFVEYVLLRGLAVVTAILPPRAVLAIGRALGRLAMLLDRRHRRAAAENLRLAFGAGLAPRQRRRLVRRTFERFGEVLAELLLFPRVARASPEAWAEVHGLEHLRAALAGGRGAFVTSGHFGNWEMIALVQARLGIPMAMVTRPLDNPWLERWMAHLRCLTGNRVIHREGAVRGMLAALARGEAVALVIDQHVRGGGGLLVEFFGRAASTSSALGMLALKRGSPIVPVFSYPLGGGRYRIEYEPPIQPRAQGADRHAEVERLTREVTARLELRVREHPELWLWMHSRWRHRPGAGATGALALEESAP